MSIHHNDCFQDLILHYGHSLECVVYGDENDPDEVAIECVTCNEVLVCFERESQGPTLFIDPETDPSLLDELVHEVASNPASDINNQGLQAQVEYICEQLGEEAGIKAIQEAIAEGH